MLWRHAGRGTPGTYPDGKYCAQRVMQQGHQALGLRCHSKEHRPDPIGSEEDTYSMFLSKAKVFYED